MLFEIYVDFPMQYQELFAICQGLPGPGSTKMIFCLALLHAGFIPAVFVFLVWRYATLFPNSPTY